MYGFTSWFSILWSVCVCFDCETMPSWSTQLCSLLRIKYSNAPFLALFCLRLVVGKEVEERALYFHTNSKIASTAVKDALIF